MPDDQTNELLHTLATKKLAHICLFKTLRRVNYAPDGKGGVVEMPDLSGHALTELLKEKLASGARILVMARDFRQAHHTYHHMMDARNENTLHCTATAIRIGDDSYQLIDAPGMHCPRVHVCSHIVVMPIDGGEFGKGAHLWKPRLHVCADRLGLINGYKLREVLTHAATGWGLLEVDRPAFSVITDAITRTPRAKFAQLKGTFQYEVDRARNHPIQYAVKVAGVLILGFWTLTKVILRLDERHMRR